MNRYERVLALLPEVEGTGLPLETKIKEFGSIHSKHDGDGIVRLMMLDHLADQIFALKREASRNAEWDKHLELCPYCRIAVESFCDDGLSRFKATLSVNS